VREEVYLAQAALATNHLDTRADGGAKKKHLRTKAKRVVKKTTQLSSGARGIIKLLILKRRCQSPTQSRPRVRPNAAAEKEHILKKYETVAENVLFAYSQADGKLAGCSRLRQQEKGPLQINCGKSASKSANAIAGETSLTFSESKRATRDEKR